MVYSDNVFNLKVILKYFKIVDGLQIHFIDIIESLKWRRGF